jgi:23S rRNA pseudouridine1911/1915/1917 synthase
MSIHAETFVVSAAQAELTLAALLRLRLPGQSWSQVRRLVETRHARVGGDLCLDPARRVHAGETVELLARPAARPRQVEQVVVRHVDAHLVVVEKPAGVCTVRHPTERAWKKERKELSPTLEEIVPRLIARAGARSGDRPQRATQRATHGPQPRLRVVQRLDKGTSGLVVFARTVEAERDLGRQFRRHTVIRRYLALVPGHVRPQRIATRLVRDRGDGRRGSTDIEGLGKEAVTHVDVVEQLASYALLGCRLETGRTHQIRIHLAELGHPVCGDKVYIRRRDGTIAEDRSGVRRLALHATELGFKHPVTGAAMRWTMPLPADLQALLEGMRGRE